MGEEFSYWERCINAGVQPNGLWNIPNPTQTQPRSARRWVTLYKWNWCKIHWNRNGDTYMVTHQVRDYILLTLIWEFPHVAYLPCQFCHFFSCPSRIRQMSDSELPNQSQQNAVADLTGHPVLGGSDSGYMVNFFRDFGYMVNRIYTQYGL